MGTKLNMIKIGLVFHCAPLPLSFLKLLDVSDIIYMLFVFTVMSGKVCLINSCSTTSVAIINCVTGISCTSVRYLYNYIYCTSLHLYTTFIDFLAFVYESSMFPFVLPKVLSLFFVSMITKFLNLNLEFGGTPVPAHSVSSPPAANL